VSNGNVEIADEKKVKSKWVTFMAVGLSVFSIYTAGYGFLQDLMQRSFVLGITLLLCYRVYPLVTKKMKVNMYFGIIDWILMVIGTTSCAYVFFFYDQIMSTGIIASQHEVVLGILLIISLLEASRRTIGPVFVIMALICLLYSYFGPYMPSAIAHKGYPLERLFGFLYVSAEGIWGQVTGIASNIIPIFLVFGGFLGYGMGRNTFKDIATHFTGNSKGGTGKIAVLSSAMFGTISGSPTANVVTTGTFTIPTMKAGGFPPHFAAAVEAVASSGGVIMPPIMGAGAFIMSQLISVPYLDICKAAVLPAILYFFGLFFYIHINAPPTEFKATEDLPDKKTLYKELTFFVIPVVTLVTLLIIGYTPVRSAYWAALATAALCFSPLAPGTIQDRLKRVWRALEQAGYQIILIVPLCACAGILIGIMNQTGLTIRMSNIILSFSGGNLFIVLALAAVCTMMLGMAVPPTAAYVVAAVVAIPPAIHLGVPVLAGHLFVFYFAVASNITPPVCGAVYVASGMAGAKWIKTAKVAMVMAVSLYIMPFSFAYNQAILLEKGMLLALFVFVLSAVGIGGIITGVSGRLSFQLHFLERAAIIIAGLMSMLPMDVFLQSRVVGGIAVIALSALNMTGKGFETIVKRGAAIREE